MEIQDQILAGAGGQGVVNSFKGSTERCPFFLHGVNLFCFTVAYNYLISCLPLGICRLGCSLGVLNDCGHT